MRSISWLSVIIPLALLLEVRCARRYVEYYAENNCKRFQDDAIEYRLQPSGRHSAAIIRATRLLSYSYPFNCNITVAVFNSDDKKVLLSVRKVSFPSRTHCVNYIKIYEKKTNYKLCNKYDIPGKKVDFTDNNNGSSSMKFLYHTESYGGGTFGTDDDFFSSGFEMLVTAYTKAPCGKDLDFLCKNGRCISRELRFDGYDNCGDGSDETVSIMLPVGAAVGICVAILLVIAAIFVFVFLARRTRRVTTYAAASQPLYPAGPARYPQQTFAPFPPYPQAPPAQSQYGGIGNPNYPEQPPPYQ